MKTKKTQTKRKFVSLAEARPDLAKEWNYEKNGDLKPEDVSYGSNKKVWWKLDYAVPTDYQVESLRGKFFKFEWEASIGSRSQGRDCPYLTGKAVWSGFNDLATVNQELAAQWHPTKNGNLKPTQITANANKKVWWMFRYKIPNNYPVESLRGKIFNFEWKALIKSRSKDTNCPYLVGQAVWPGFNDLATVNQELAAQWHPTKNGNLKPTQVTINSGLKVWWILPYDIPNDYPVESLRGKHFDFDWESCIISRNKGQGCPYLTGRAIWPGFNDLATVNQELAVQWHPTKNGNLKPTQVTANAGMKVWWLLRYKVPNDYPVKSLRGKLFKFEWEAYISNRNRRQGCPYLIGKAVWPGFNDLATINPELAAQWHPTKNGNLNPTQITANTTKKAWWLLCYNVPNDYPVKSLRGRYLKFEWESCISNRNKGVDCPYLTTSKGEKYIKRYLQKNNIGYYIQHKFSDLFGTGNGKLSYDFAIPNAKSRFILIEYNGIQHYESCEFFGGEEQFKKQQEHDRRKREYAKQHGYKLITIKYTYDTYEKVAEYLDKHLPKEDYKKIPKKAA